MTGYAEQTEGGMQEFAYIVWFKGSLLEDPIV